MIDLHTHSVFSDGTFTPEELVDKAEEMGLYAVALCDHNSVCGLPRFLKAAEGKNVKAVPGAEFSVEYLGKELHLLALFISGAYFDEITAKMEFWKQKKGQCNVRLGEALCRQGLIVDVPKLMSEAPNVIINRAHIGAELMRLGYVESVEEAFRKYLNKDKGFYVEPERPDVFETITYIREIGALPVLAHPLLDLSRDELRCFLPEAKAHGLSGMEVRYSKFSEEETEFCKSVADEFGILYSGGSDFHGENKPHIRLGCGSGTLCVDNAVYDRLYSALSCN